MITEDAIRVGAVARDWEEAVRIGGDLLVAMNKVTRAYVQQMIDNLRRLGPYVIVAPGIALPHARPEDGVLSSGISVVRLARPVPFGPGEDQQVEVVICLAAEDAASHLDWLKAVAAVLGDERRLTALKQARDAGEIAACFGVRGGGA